MISMLPILSSRFIWSSVRVGRPASPSSLSVAVVTFASSSTCSSSLIIGPSSSTRSISTAIRGSGSIPSCWITGQQELPQQQQHAAQQRSSFSSSTAPGSTPIIKTKFDLPDPTIPISTKYSDQIQLTKIVATIGPTSEQEKPMYQVVKAGMRIMRLNFSHATPEEVVLRCTNLEKAEKSLYAPEWVQRTCGIMLDTKGPEIRTGKLANDTTGHVSIQLQAGNKITLHTQPIVTGSTISDLYIDYPSLYKAVVPGMKVLLDDGTIILTVESIDPIHKTLSCQIENTGDLRSRAGVNLPLADTTDLPAMSDKDKADIMYGMTMDIDYVAASFVQTGDGVRQIRQHMIDCAQKLGWSSTQPLPLIISKIETTSALRHFDDILMESDAIMVARGDLGVEIPLQQVTNAQKEMVAACNAVGKPVIVATQMLESMSKNPRPTRAEVSDVTNAVYDGADAVMLSGESAKGKYPDHTVRFMNEIIISAERYARSGAIGYKDKFHSFHVHPYPSTMSGYITSPKTPNSAIARAAVAATRERADHCAAIVVLDGHSDLARLVASYRPNVPIFTFCPTSKMARQLQLHRGVHPIVGLQNVPAMKRTHQALLDAKHLGYLHTGEEVIVLSMDQDEGNSTAAAMKIALVP